ncbi:hypothetical protein [Streptomyces sp. YIM 98790]|uniref:hypothetical protein n=1 Tax=Streptomyces sp. YIM 98790 TaxID=2689077 RepID=UPI00140A2C3F|nr:hypothetical protein [Streptomyces sp. YIM 98790]
MNLPVTSARPVVRHLVTSVEPVKNALRVSGHAYLDGRSNDRPGFQAAVRDRDGSREYRFSVSRTATPGLVTEDGGVPCPDSGFDILLNPAELADGSPLPDGLWDLWLTVETAEETATVRIGTERGSGAPTEPLTHTVAAGRTQTVVTGFFAPEDGGYSLDIGGVAHPGPVLVRGTGVRWLRDAPATLELTTRAPADPDAVSYEAVERTSGRRISATASVRDRTLTARLPLEGGGDWQIVLCVRRDGEVTEHPLPASSKPATRRWRRALTPWYAKPYHRKGAGLAVRVDRVNVLQGLRRRVAG